MMNTTQTLELDKVTIAPVVRYQGTVIPELYVSILSLIGQGWSNVEIGYELELSTRTIEGLLSKIRDLIATINGERLSERGLVIFAREMLDGYRAFLRVRDQERLYSNELNNIELIEDWDDEDDDDFTGLDPDTDEPPSENRPNKKIVDLKQYRHEYEITNFEAEERELIYANGTHYLV